MSTKTSTVSATPTKDQPKQDAGKASNQQSKTDLPSGKDGKGAASQAQVKDAGKQQAPSQLDPKQEEMMKKKTEAILVSSGLLDAYEYLQRQILKHGIPKGNVYDFASQTVLKFERKVKAEEQKRLENLKITKEIEIEHLKSASKSPQREDIKSIFKKDAKPDPKDVKPDPKAPQGKVDPKADPKAQQKVDPKADPKAQQGKAADPKAAQPDPKAGAQKKPEEKPSAPPKK